MPDMWIDVDTAVTVPVNVLALIDDTDFKTRETGIVYNQAGMDLVWNFVTSAGVITQTAVTPTTSGDYDWTHSGDAMFKIEIPASGGASINNDTEGYGWFTGICDGVLAWRGPVIGFRAAGLNDLQCDSAYSATRGLAGTALPAAASDAAGGVPISDAGGLDLDAKLANTNEVTAARMGALTDLIDGGRLDLLIDAIKAITDAMPDAGALSDLATLEARLTAARAGYLDNLNGHTAQTGDSFARIGAPAGASIAADLLVIDNFVDDLETRLSAARAGYLDNLNGHTAQTGDSFARIGAAGASLTDLGGMSAGMKAEVENECDEALVANHLDHLFKTTYDPASKPGAADGLLNELVENDGGVSRYTANALEQAPSGGTNPNVLISTTIASVTDQTHYTLTAGADFDDAYKDQAFVHYDASNNDYPSVRKCTAYTGATKTVTLDSAPDFTIVAGDGVKGFETAPGTTAPTVGENADAVWDEARAGHTASGSFGEALQDGYWADIDYRRADDESPAKDRYTVRWYKGMIRLTSGITSPAITVLDRTDGSTLINGETMTDVGSGMLLYTEQTNRQELGTPYEIVVSATIGGSSRSWSKGGARDS